MRCSVKGCKEWGSHEFRITVPAKGDSGASRWFYNGQTLCKVHKETAKVSDFMTDTWRKAIEESLARSGKVPDFDRATIEWRATK